MFGRFLLICAVGALLFFVGHVEYLRFKTCEAECFREQHHDVQLAQSTICTDPEIRANYKRAGTVDCDKAEGRLLLTPRECGLKRWVTQSELARLWTMMTDSYWALLGFMVPVIGIFLYLIINGIFDERRDERMFEKQKDFLRQMREFSEQQQHHEAPVKRLISPIRKKRKNEDSEFYIA